MKRVLLTAFSGLAILTAMSPAALAQGFPRQRYNSQFDPRFNPQFDQQHFGQQDRFRNNRFDNGHFQRGDRFRGQSHFQNQRGFRGRNRRFRGRNRGFERLVRFKFGRRNRF